MKFFTYEATILEDISIGEHVKKKKKQGKKDPVKESEKRPERNRSLREEVPGSRGTRTFESFCTNVV